MLSEEEMQAKVAAQRREVQARPLARPSSSQLSARQLTLIKLYQQYQVLLVLELKLTLATAGDDMALDPQIADLLARIDTATSAIAARIQKLIDGASSGKLDVAAVVAALQPEVDKLEAMGKDPTNPVG